MNCKDLPKTTVAQLVAEWEQKYQVKVDESLDEKYFRAGSEASDSSDSFFGISSALSDCANDRVSKRVKQVLYLSLILNVYLFALYLSKLWGY